MPHTRRNTPRKASRSTRTAASPIDVSLNVAFALDASPIEAAARLLALSAIGLGSLSPIAAWGNCVSTPSSGSTVTVSSGDLTATPNAVINCTPSGAAPLTLSINSGRDASNGLPLPWASGVTLTVNQGVTLEPAKVSPAIALGAGATLNLFGKVQSQGSSYATSTTSGYSKEDTIKVRGNQAAGRIDNAGTILSIGGHAIDGIEVTNKASSAVDVHVINQSSGVIYATGDSASGLFGTQPAGIVLGAGSRIENLGRIEIDDAGARINSAKGVSVGSGSTIRNEGLIRVTARSGDVLGLVMDEGSSLENNGRIEVSGASAKAIEFNQQSNTSSARVTNSTSGVIDASQGREAIVSNMQLSIINRGQMLGGSSGAISVTALTGAGPSSLTLGDGSILRGGASFTERALIKKTDAELRTASAIRLCNSASPNPILCFRAVQVLPQTGYLVLEGSGTYSDTIRGLNTLTKEGTGAWTLGTPWMAGSASDQYQTGNFRGTLAIDVQNVGGELKLTGAIADNADGTKAQITKTGAGALTLSGVNTYSGPTDIQQGTLNLVGTPSVQKLDQSAFTVASGAAVVVSGQAAIGSLEGAGRVSIPGTALAVGPDNRSTTFSGTLDGPGALIKRGTGRLTLTGSGSGGLLIASTGELIVNGMFQRNAAVSSNGLLGGSGTLAALDNAGRLAPGNSVGTLNLTGAFTQQAKGTLEVEIRPDGSAADLLAATGASQLAGALKVSGESGGLLTPGAAGPAGNPRLYTILTSGGGVSGQFQAPAPLGAYTFTTTYGANDVKLGVVYSGFAAVQAVAQTPVPSAQATVPRAGTKNQITKAKHVDQVAVTSTGFNSGNTDMDTVLLNLANVPANGLADAYNSIIAEPYAAFMTVLLAHNDFYAESVFERAQACSLRGRGSLGGAFPAEGAGSGSAAGAGAGAAGVTSLGAGSGAAAAGRHEGRCDPATGRQHGLWADATWAKGTIRGSDGLSGYHYRMNGLLLGLDTSINRETAVGFSTGFTSPGLYNYELSNASIRGDGYFFSGYGSWVRDGLELVGLAGYSRGSYTASRGIQFGNINRTATGSFGNDGVIAAVKAAYFMPLNNFELVPEVGLTYSRVWQNGFTETGADSLNLKVDDASAYSVVSSVGTRASLRTRLFELPARLQGLVRYDHDWSANRNEAHRINASLTGLPGLGSMSFVGQNRGPNSLLLGGVATLKLAPDVDLFGGANYRWTTNGREVNFALGIRGLH